MIKHPEGRIEGTPEELAAYQAAKERLNGLGQQPRRLPLPNPNSIEEPWPITKGVFEPNIRWDAAHPPVCEACRNGGACGCVLSGPVVR